MTTTYAYNNAGDLQSVSYTGGVSTPATTYTYDRRGRRWTAVRNGITTSFTYNDANLPLTESHSGGTLSGLSMNWSYDSALRLDVATAKNGANTLQAADCDYTWDGENRLVEMKRDTSTPTVSSRLRLTFEYDHQGRRIRKQFYTYNSGWVEQRDTTCLYDGWTVMAELDANASNARLRTYVWGTDLSGSAQGAGGVGGLLWVNNYQTTFDGQTLPTGIHFVAYDGNGNVLALVKASDGSVSARYEYGPFAEPVRITGALADAQPIRFSTKWTDLESGFLYYGYRYYSPSTGRWLSRDPIQEEGFTTARRMGRGKSALRQRTFPEGDCVGMRNDCLSAWDYLGLRSPNYGCPAQSGMEWDGVWTFPGEVWCMYKHCEASSSFQDWHEVGPVNRDDRGEQIDEWWDGGDEDGVCVGLFLVLTRSKEVLLSPCCKGCKWLTVVYKLLAVRDGEVVVGEEIPGKRREGVTSECGKGGWVETGVTKDELKPKERIVEKGREQCGQL